MDINLFEIIRGVSIFYTIFGAIVLYSVDGLFDIQSASNIFKFVTTIALIMAVYLSLIITSVTPGFIIAFAIIIAILLLACKKYIFNDDVLKTLPELTHIPYFDKIIYGLMLCLGIFAILVTEMSTETYAVGPIIDFNK